ncbi:MAG: cytochrome c biogenesis protein CcdA [Gemmatimonadales bacterium]|nr:cytochrome c biogenesis protein CcdA [Gemmatimonadales bacterium]NIN11215.1 cytochrome c biogenesis protein CcdA [Gemmatimonadales bacterium]NIN49814.1 cytochrome c biogenesis protein CcdA [Gemmatimonadales bacterium]NIP07278.1 cytochrome c biogenesis protein CcdA [Gemmatimonadales bacterium]NIR02973.1 cytochrome c biogenesis protein CcdA [Gemmatimonadales bacterium]
MAAESVGFAVAFVAGLLSFLSPCVLPLVPSYVSFITGLSLDELGERRWVAFTHALLFIAGFTLIFIALGASATQLGRFLNYNQAWLERFGGVLIVFFGLYLLGVVRWGALARERRLHLQDKPLGYLGSLLVGLAFGAGWTPCIGPILGSILTYTGVRSSLGEGIVLLLAYSLGLAVPFLLAAVAVEKFIDWFKRFRRYIPLTTKIAGGILVFVGVLLVTGYFSLLAGWLQGLTPDFLRERL